MAGLSPRAGRLPPYALGAFDRDEVGFLLRARADLGPWFTVAVGGKPTVIAATRGAAGELFAAERGHLDVLNTPLVHDLFGRAVFNLSGAAHRDARRLLLPALTGRALRGYLEPLRAVAADAAHRLIRPVPDLPGAVGQVTLAMSSRVLLGIDPSDPDASLFGEQFGAFVAATDAPAGRARYGSARYWAGRRARTGLAALVARRAATVLASPGQASGPDVLTILAATFGQIPPSDAGVLGDHLLAMLIAARETTASLAGWCLTELAQRPQLADRLAGEAHQVTGEPTLLLSRLQAPGLRALLAETERMHTPNLLSVRTVTHPVELGGHRLPTGTRVAYSPAATAHFDPEDFADPFTFRADRFGPDGQSTTGLLTFGAGVHACPGRSLAELMTLVLLAAALVRGQPWLPAGPPTRVRYRPAKAPALALPFVLRPHREAVA